MNIIYLGTPQFAVKPLKSIIDSNNHKVVAVVTQPDKAKARGKKVLPCAVKEFAEKAGILVLQYNRIRDKEAVEELKSLQADIMVTCAYGQILSTEILTLTKYGVINIHASLLPKYRGSSPVQWALVMGETEVGITTMQTAYEVDSGDILLQKSIQLQGFENTEEVLDMLSPIGGELIVETLDLINKGEAKFTKQDKALVSHFPMLKKEDGRLDFSKNAKDIQNFIRGMNPWPGAFTFTKYGTLKVLLAEIDMENIYDNAISGEVVVSDAKKGLTIKCLDKGIKFLRVQSENSKEMDITDFLRGKPIEKGTRL